MKKYLAPEVELLVLNAMDVILASGDAPVVPDQEDFVGDITAGDTIVADIGLGEDTL